MSAAAPDPNLVDEQKAARKAAIARTVAQAPEVTDEIALLLRRLLNPPTPPQKG